MASRTRTGALLLLLLLLQQSLVFSWKKEEFRNCNQTPFCKRARSRKPGSSNLVVTDVSINDGDLIAKLQRKNAGEAKEEQEEVMALRLKIDEDPSLDPPKKRFEVPDLWLQRVSTEVLDGDSAPSSIVYLSDAYEGVVRHDPFEVYVRKKGGDRVLSLNSHGLFDFEQLRKKKEDEDWEERFRSHTDPRRYCPQSISFDVSFYGADFVYGIPEHASSLALKATRGPGVEFSEPYRLFNLDVFKYLRDSPFELYESIPYMLSHGKGHGTSGFFLSGIVLPSSQGRIDTLWMSEACIVDAFFFVGPGPKDVMWQYDSVTGTLAMPQFFAIGYNQCRWNYRDEEDVQQVDSKFDEFDIPYDVIWLDMEHPDGKRYLTHIVTIADPHINWDESFYLHKEATQKGYSVKDATGKDFDGWCWPGASSYPDTLNTEIRSRWAEKFSFQNYVGSTPSLYIWNDMNEPSVFNGPEAQFPLLLYHLKVLTLSLTGISSLVSADVGGFFGNPEPELLVCWYQLGAYYPFFRSHAHMIPIGENLGRQHIHYTSLPYFYTLFRQANTSGIPLVRPLWMNFLRMRLLSAMMRLSWLETPFWYKGSTEVMPNMHQCICQGDNLGMTSEQESPTGYKEGVTRKFEVSEESIPAFQKAGTIIPRKDRSRRSTPQVVNDPYPLVIALNGSLAAEGELYVDDGKSFPFQRGAYMHRRFVFSEGKLTSSNIAPPTSGKALFTSECVIERIIIPGLSGSKSALVESANFRADIESGPLNLRGRGSPAVLTICKPNVRIEDDWIIKIF
ncbi:hypothetical protein NE237_016898 [Protea cynaroides]|uniref:Glucosidase II subunit alpha n=1 Tax=Protea cynaroides TaxID=273540 RepID=A0A9Q0HJ53_9MAGN|nr:hypothetical protein NE237_016898 [Protea cynaroides]